MDERDYKAMNELKMSNTEETNKISAKQFLKTFPDNEDVVSLSLKHWDQVYEWMESFASMRVEQAKEEWEKEKVEIIKEYQDEVNAFNILGY